MPYVVVGLLGCLFNCDCFTYGECCIAWLMLLVVALFSGCVVFGVWWRCGLVLISLFGLLFG